ncbi:MAG TPA: glycosyltransferase [Planctomycetota bacterium]|nr:glycosyltransferase [Planctomycetota bacterium]
MTLRCSVVIPVRDMARYLAEAIESVLAQDEPACEIVVVDDGSTDGSADVARRYAPRVRLIDEGRLGGAFAARNRGLREVTGDAVVFLDADDRLLPRALARYRRALARDARIAVAYGEALIIDAQGNQVGTGKPPLVPQRRPSGDALPFLLRGNPIATPGAACIRRESLGAAFRDLPMGEDWELYARLAGTGRFSYLRGPPVVAYRRHPESITAVRAKGVAALLPAIDAIFGNPALRARFPAWFLTSRRRLAVAGAHAFLARFDLRNRRWDPARRNLIACLRRDPWRPREWILLLAAVTRRMPEALHRRIK